MAPAVARPFWYCAGRLQFGEPRLCAHGSQHAHRDGPRVALGLHRARRTHRRPDARRRVGHRPALRIEDETRDRYYDPFATPDNQLFVLPAGGEYSFVYEFAAAWVPDAAAASAATKASFIEQTGACVTDPNGGSACPGGPQMAESSTTTLQGDVLTQKLGASPPPGTLVMAFLDLGVLYASYIAAHPGALDVTTEAWVFETE